jgi:hypothetical protein
MKKPNITYKSVLQKIKNIEERNKAFDELSDEGKRLEIAWDALKLLKTDIITPSIGYYWGYKLEDIAEKSKDSKAFQKELNDVSSYKKCSVCARGAVMLSLIRLGNKVIPSYYAGYGTESNVRGFYMASMEMMEEEYENSLYEHPYENNTKEKLMNILCNVLVNGDFNEKDTTNYLI